jgi:predicted nucleic acid-binding protein
VPTWLRSLKEAREELFAPALFEYEVCSALWRSVTRGILGVDEATTALDLIDAIHVNPISPASSLHKRALAWAARLGHSMTYDAHYLALAEEMKCHLLAADARLARSTKALGADWVESVI